MVESSKTILFADNVSEFLVTRAEFLENAGYQVLKAFTLEEARRLFREAHFHLAILDIRLVNDDDEKDISGILLAKDPAYRSVPKIILTGFPSVSAVKEALRPALDGLPPAVDFVAKADGPDAMIEAVEKAFTQFVHINWGLEIQWDRRDPLSFPHLVGLLQPNLRRDALTYRAGELEDLIRQLFHDYQQIRLGRLLWHDGGRFCVPVLARSSQGTTDLRVLICGERENLKQEQENLKKLAPPTLHCTRLAASEETTHFGANLYELPGADIETVQTLRDLFQVGKERSIRMALSHLLGDVLNAWHRRGQTVQGPPDLMALYRQRAGLAESDMPRIEVERRVELLIQAARTLEAVDIQRSNGMVTFVFPGQSPQRYPDPVATMYTAPIGYDTPVVCRVSPGRLTADDILVDANQHTWLTDFAHAGQVPQWWDFVCLEAAIRFDLTQAPDLLAWQDFEECLVAPTHLHDRLQDKDVIADLRRSVVLIEQVRRQAGSEAGPDVRPYYAGLLVWTLSAMAHHDPGVLYTQADRLRGAHLLLAASMIASRLSNQTVTSIEGALRLDDEGRVWIGDHCTAILTGMRLKLLRCLYERAGQTVTCQTIVETVYGEKYDITDRGQKQRIRQEVRRLREEIEPEPDRPRYILTTRDKGYRLQVSGKMMDNT